MKKKNILRLCCYLMAFWAVSNTNLLAQTEAAVQHKEGPYYEDFMPNGTQKTHEYMQIIYVNPTYSNVLLALASQGVYSPHHYYRWYNYDTNSLDTRISPTTTTYEHTNGYVNFGGSVYVERANYDISGITYPQRIGCDISAYTDYTVVDGRVTVEPTLSYRTIFEIRDGNEIATELKEVTATGDYLQDISVYMPAVPANLNELPRVTLNLEDKYYFGYDGVGTLRTGIVNITGDRLDSYNSPFIFVNPGAAGTSTVITATLTVGSGTNERSYNIARFNIEFIGEAPEPFEDISEYRTIEYMDENYILVSKLDFDYDTLPATPANNMWHEPLPYDLCDYAFVSEALVDDGYRGLDGKVAQWNEYGFYKTANVLSGISRYSWYNGGQKVYDRRYFQTEGKEQGYFMYIDAAQPPGVIAKIPIDNLCSGTTLFVSAAIASLTLTGSPSYPDINFIFLGIDEDGNETELSRYTSGDFPGVSSGSSVPAPWYQMYNAFTFEQQDTEFVSYILQLENNCTSTAGGDYAVDDFRVYRSKPAVQANQIQLQCGDEEPKIRIQVEYDKLITALGLNEKTESGETFTIQFKILDEDLDPIEFNYGTEENPLYDYGRISISTCFEEITKLIEGEHPPLATGDPGIFAYTETGSVGSMLFRYITFLVPNTSGITKNTTLYAVVANGEGVFETDDCALISDPFVVIPCFDITVDGVLWMDGDGWCYGNEVTLGANLKSRNPAFENIETLFDWYLGTKEEFEQVAGNSPYSLREALEIYRTEYPAPNEGDNLSTNFQGAYTQEIYTILHPAVESRILVLNSSEISLVIREGNTILAIPLPETAVLEDGVEIADVCDDMLPIYVTGPPFSPVIQLGNEHFVNLRMGLGQILNIQSDATKTLTVPIWDFNNSDGTKSKVLTLSNNTDLFLVETDDPDLANMNSYYQDTYIKIGEIVNIDTQGLTDDNIVFRIPGELKYTPREGFTYTLEFHFNEESREGEIIPCDGTGRFRVIIVPEYLTWTGTAGDNWNNDDNWRKSVASELYKTDYTDDPESRGFVPMDFTKVTIPSIDGTEVFTNPWLYKLTGSTFLDMDNKNYATEGEKNANKATENIEYDLAAALNGNVYYAINFYGNTAEQVYFKPMAEMRNTNYLTYNTAHIDFEINPNRWYMLASPLKNVVAGDMYLPTTSGRHETEAFQPMYFDTSEHHRFDPAVYQRNWDKSNCMVHHFDGGSEDTYISSNWSQVYSMVDELYEPGRGFSIKTQQSTSNADKVLFRLPKNDSIYVYYTYDGTLTGHHTDILRTENGRLAFENEATNVTVNLANETTDNAIFLVGNPFVATLDMEKFFSVNTNFEPHYWIVTSGGISAAQINSDGTVTGTGDEIMDGKVAPMQAFFIERSDGTNTSQIVFTPEMTIPASGSALRSGAVAAETLRIKAKRGNSASSIVIKRKEGAENGYKPQEDMRVIMDTHLEDVPTLYSMAGNHAAMINVVSGWQDIPLGIYSDSEEEVLLTFKGIETLSTPVFLLDNMNGELREITGDNNTVTITGSTHGRYFIAFSSGIDNEVKYDNLISMYSSNGNISIRSAYPDILQAIKVYGMNGVLIKDYNGINATGIDIELSRDQMYIINVISDSANITRKVFCR